MTREYCVVTHTRGSEWILIWFATRVVGPVSKLVNPQHGSPYTQRGTAPKKKKAMLKIKSRGSRMRGTLDEFPLDRKHTRAGITDRIESTRGQVNGIGVTASGAFIRHGHGNGLVICRVGNAHRLSANVLVKQCRIYGANEVRILMYRAASTGGAILSEKCALASVVHVTAIAITIATGLGRSRRSR